MKTILSLSLSLSRYSLLATRYSLLVLLLMQVTNINTAIGKNSFDFTPVVNGYGGQQKVFPIKMNIGNFPDIAMYENNNVKVLINNENLSYNNYTSSGMTFDFSALLFGGAAGFTLPAGEQLLEVNDMDNDGDGDLLVYKPNAPNDALYIYTNNSTGYNAPTLLISFATGTWQFHTAELDNDGVNDVYAYNEITGDLFAVINDLAPSFDFWSNIGVHPGIQFYEGNFTPSAYQDIAFSYQVAGTYTVTIIDNQNNAPIPPAQINVSNPITGNSVFFYPGNFDNNTYTDLAVYFPDNGGIKMLHGNGITFTISPNFWYVATYPNNVYPPHSYIGGPYAGAAGDNLLEFYSNTPIAYQGSMNMLYTNNNNTAFQKNTWELEENGNGVLHPANADWHLRNADFNNDGRVDILCYNPTAVVGGKIVVGINAPHFEGYCWPLSAKNSGSESIDLYIAGNGPRISGVCKIEIKKFSSIDNTVSSSFAGTGGVAIPGVNSFTINPVAQYIPEDAYKNGCNWQQNLTINIPADWETGYYAAELIDIYGKNDYITFIVKSATPSCKKVALIANTNTWWAYNKWTGYNGDYELSGTGSKYTNSWDKYSFMRPNPTARPNVYPTVNAPFETMQTSLMHRTRAELWIFTWLKNSGYEPDVITDIDLHINEGNFINGYSYLIFGTHPEYWTGTMYDVAKQFQTNGAGLNGGNLVCIGGNSIFEVCELDLENKQMVFYPGPASGNIYPLPPGPLNDANNCVGGVAGGSNGGPGSDRFDYFFETFEFGTQDDCGTALSPAPKLPINLTGAHYNIINNINFTSSYFEKTPAGAGHFIMQGVATEIGELGYNNYNNPNGGAAGRETDMFSNSAVNVPTPTPSIYSPVILARTIQNPYINTAVCYPNGYNMSEIIYVPSVSGANRRGFVFTAGSITFGGSLAMDADLQQMMHNVLQHEYNIDLEVINASCNNGNGSIQVDNCVASDFSLQPGGANFLNVLTATFSNLNAGTYTLTCTDALGSTITKTIQIVNPVNGNFCECANGAALVVMPNMILKSNATASDLISQFGNIISNKTFYFDGVFTVDANITFDNCELNFTTTGSVVLDATHDITIVNGTVLQAACDYWLGIEANNACNKIAITGSNIENAIIGIDASNNALVEITNSYFVDNQAAGILMTNMTDPNYAGYVYGSSFDASTPIPSLPNALKVGIDLQNVAKMQIGDYADENKGNTFTHVRRGIGIWQGNLPMISNIGIYNNQFDEIKETYYTNVLYPVAFIINNTYNLGFGAAVYAYNGGAPVSNAINLDIRNVNAAINTLAFTNCDKGIVSVHSSVIAENLYMDFVPMGICNYSLIANTSYVANHNKLYHTYIGMQFAGEKLSSEAKDNTIECTLYPNGVSASNVLGADYIWPKGIDVSYLVNTGSNSFAISDNNHISIPHYAGVGINLENAGAMVTVKDNTVDLGSTDASDNIVCYGATTLAGIASYTALGAHIVRNDINGNTAGANLGNANSRVDACGILINKGEQQKIGCNSINYIRFGLMGWNENNIGLNNNLLVQGNTINHSDAGWVFRHLANEGTLGEVGDPNNDNNNLFLWPYTPAKVFKYCLGLTPGLEIYTNSIIQLTESLSENINTQVNDCPYIIGQPNAGYTIFNINAACPTLQIIAGSATTISLSDAIAIATNTKQYIEFPVLAYWYDSKKLYEYLLQNPAIKNSNDTLLDFFDAMSNAAIAQEQNADQKLQDLISSFAGISPAVLEGLWIDATTQNELINDTELHDANEQRTNSIYLRMVRLGMDSLLQDDKEFLATLAPQCPYTAGSAVYKARTLNKFLNPGAMYDDLKICNQVGVYKQGNSQQGSDGNSTTSLISLEGQTLSKLKPTYESVQLGINDFILYPNPADDIVNIRYNANHRCRIELLDITGRKIKVVDMPGGVQKTTIEISELTSGVYTYKFFVGNSLQKTGKLLMN